MHAKEAQYVDSRFSRKAGAEHKKQLALLFRWYNDNDTMKPTDYDDVLSVVNYLSQYRRLMGLTFETDEGYSDTKELAFKFTIKLDKLYGWTENGGYPPVEASATEPTEENQADLGLIRNDNDQTPAEGE